jgi:hypothetical protein
MAHHEWLNAQSMKFVTPIDCYTYLLTHVVRCLGKIDVVYDPSISSAVKIEQSVVKDLEFWSEVFLAKYFPADSAERERLRFFLEETPTSFVEITNRLFDNNGTSFGRIVTLFALWTVSAPTLCHKLNFDTNLRQLHHLILYTTEKVDDTVFRQCVTSLLARRRVINNERNAINLFWWSVVICGGVFYVGWLSLRRK